ncbi:MAG: PIN domain-containing protein [bacterium]
MIILDTSALIRFFTKDIPQQAIKIKTLLESGESVLIPEVVLPEIEYVLEGKVYNLGRKDVEKALSFLETHRSIQLSKESYTAISIYKETSLDMADCLVVASALERKGALASFDKKLLAYKGVSTYIF